MKKLSTTLLLLISVLCVQAQAIYSGQPNVQIDGSHNVTIPCGNGSGCYRATAHQTLTGFTTTYDVGSTPFTSFPTGGATPVAIIEDDRWTPVIGLPFNFCFFGNNYNSLLIGTNGILTFDISQATLPCAWQLDGTGTGNTLLPIPTAVHQTNSIMGPFQDIDPSDGGSISYITLGTAPRRVFVVTFQAVPHYGFSCPAGTVSTSQIALYEGTNIIDIHIANKMLCTSWNMGHAIEGIQNANGTVAYAVAGRNNTQWVATNDGQRFTPSNSRATETLIKWHILDSTAVIATTDTANLCPVGSDTTKYVIDVTYVQCDTHNNVTVHDTMSIAILQSGGRDQYLSCPSAVDSVRMAGSGTGGIWTALPGNPGPVTIVNPSSPTTVIRGFTIVGTYYFVWSGGGCTDTARVIVAAKPDAGPDVYNCVRGTATMAATGTGSWTALSTNPGATVINAPTNPNTTIDGFPVGGLYGFVWHFATCTDTAYVNVPVFGLVTSRDTSICKYQTITLSTVATPSTLGPFTYLWSDSARVVSPRSATTAIKPLLNTADFTVKVTASNGCVLIDTVTVTLAGSAPRITLSASNNNVCPGDTIYLNSTVVVENLVSCGTVDTCPDNSLLTSAAVGTNLSSTDLESPYSGDYARAKSQYLFTAAEMTAAGLSSGAITDISFFVSQMNSTAPYDSFSVSMGCTNLTTLSGGFVNTLMEVAPPAQVSVTPGWNPHPFTHFYNWDGVSNLIIQVCYTKNSTDNSDVVASTTVGAGAVAFARSFSTSGGNGCSLAFPTSSNQRPNVRFGNCAPNTLRYTWSPATLYCDTCNYTQVSVTRDSTYRLIVDDNGCINDTTIRVTINPYLAINVTPADTALCNRDTVQLNLTMGAQPPAVCLPTYTVSSVPFATIAGTATSIPMSAFAANPAGFATATDDGVAGPFNTGFPVNFYCNSFSQFWVSTNAWISFVNPYPATIGTLEYQSQAFPPTAANNNPRNEIAFIAGDYRVASNNNISYFVSGTTPNRVLVIKYSALQRYSNSAQTSTGEVHVYEGSGVIEIMIQSSNYSGTSHTTGIKQGTGVGLPAPGRNNQNYTITTPEGWRFVPTNGASAAINHIQWTPNTALSNDTISNPRAYPTTTQTYVANVDILINRFTNPEVCHVRDTAIVRAGSFPYTVTATPSVTCAGSNSQLVFSTTSTIANITWSPGPPVVSNANIANPVATVNDTTTFYVVASDVNGCSARDSVTVYTYPYPLISLGRDTTLCYTDSLRLTVPGSYSSFEWYVPGNPTPVSTAPTLTARPLSSYIARLQDAATTCFFYTDTITIDSFAHPALPVTASGPLNFCTGGNVTLSAQQSYNNYGWSTGSSNTDIPVTTTGNYAYTVTDANGCYRVSDTARVVVSSPTTISLSPVTAICSGDTALVVATTNPAGVAVQWASGGTVVSYTDTLLTTTPGTYDVYIVTGCPDTASLVLNAAASPTVALGGPIAECNCDPAIVLQPVVTPATVTYRWSDGSTGSTYTVDSVGSQSYTVTVTTPDGCTATAGQSVRVTCIEVHPHAVPDTVFAGGSFALIDSPAQAVGVSYQWYPADSLGSASFATTKGKASGGPLDTFYVIATDATTGCADTGSVVINIINQSGFRMATGFTPNGDGRNDRMYPITLPGSTVRAFRIYNRWGQLVYDNPNAPGWDGVYGGTAQGTDTYTYFVTVELPDPSDAARTITQSSEGSFQLFR